MDQECKDTHHLHRFWFGPHLVECQLSVFFIDFISNRCYPLRWYFPNICSQLQNHMTGNSLKSKKATNSGCFPDTVIITFVLTNR